MTSFNFHVSATWRQRLWPLKNRQHLHIQRLAAFHRAASESLLLLLLLWLRIFGAAGGQIFGFSISVVAAAARRGHSTVSFSNNKTLLENVRTAT